MGQDVMTTFSLRKAGEQTPMSTWTIWRAIKDTLMPATQTDDGGIAIDRTETFRAFPKPRRAERTSRAPIDIPAWRWLISG